MTSTFKILCLSCGLTMHEAAAALGVREDTAKSWYLGKRGCPPTVLQELKILFLKIDTAALNAAEHVMATAMQNGMPDQVEIGIAADDHEAQTLGWPCLGAHRAVLRRTVEHLPPDLAAKVKIVPRGSTAGTAAAADIHGK